MKANIEKTFDNSYSYFREIQILTYLNQRSAPVPLLLLSPNILTNSSYLPPVAITLGERLFVQTN